MEFHAAFHPKKFKTKIQHNESLFLIGSCFTEQIGNKFLQHKFQVLQNPNGILFNPVSISHAITGYCNNSKTKEIALFYFNELWHNWQHHSLYSGIDKKEVLEKINQSETQAHVALSQADWLMITLGSAFVYENLESDAAGLERVVANCHKMPAQTFNRRLLAVDEIVEVLRLALTAVHTLNKNTKVIFTISPVRHLREGFIENNRSKAALIQAVHSLVNEEDILYFPAYELIIDDLRDYRFYAEDMVHPNYVATNYVWEKLLETAVSGEAQAIMKEISVINAAINHKPLNPTSAQHKKFIMETLLKIEWLQNQHPHLHFTSEKERLIF
ncbi:MAG: GSCFA domain-containing protein [Ferruginibacter sp.]